MARTVSIGIQNFEDLITDQCFYVDKTNFIKEWWENRDSVTLITRPRRFGKTLTMNMVECFFSVKYAKRGELFSGLNIWKEEKFRKLQGTVPVISLTFAGIKYDTYEDTIIQIKQVIADLYSEYEFIANGDLLSKREQEYFDCVSAKMSISHASVSLRKLCGFLQSYYKKKVIILLDEFDTPLQAAYVHGYWDELVSFIRGLFEATFKVNPYLDRAILTGITRISKESLFSGLNHLKVVSMTSDKYTDSFGFTQEEVSTALKEFGLEDKEDEVRFWYDGFTIGNRTDIYNPWSITNFLDEKKFQCYWANTSDNSLVNELIRRGSRGLKVTMEQLLEGGTVRTEISDHIDFKLLRADLAMGSEASVWNLLFASGYLTVRHDPEGIGSEFDEYDLKITNEEVRRMFRLMIRRWFSPIKRYNEFIGALLDGDVERMNKYMNEITSAMFSTFDTGKKPSEKAEPERFYHGFVLGLMVDLVDYAVTSNRESGYGRYDIMLKPKEGKNLPAIILEFKVYDSNDGKDLAATVLAALKQIEERKYATSLITEGIPKERIREYGFAFEGKTVLIDGSNLQRVDSIIKSANEKTVQKAARKKPVKRKRDVRKEDSTII